MQRLDSSGCVLLADGWWPGQRKEKALRDSETHLVTNQVPPLQDYDLLEADIALCEGLEREGAGWAQQAVRAYGLAMGSRESLEWAQQANSHPPELKSHDRFGHRLDEVEFHPGWHAIMRLAMQHEVHNLPWREARTGAHVARTAKHYFLSQIEAGAACPITMTFACVPALRQQPDVGAFWEERVRGTQYEPKLLPASEKCSVLVGMAMTEKQGGSDVRSNSTRATRIGSSGDYGLVGHKWFCSAPMCDAFLTLAQTDRGLTCFLVPRILPDGSRNAFQIQRLKNKLGNRSNASSEIEYRDAFAQRLGDEGRGIPTIIEMVHHTRLDCVSGSAGLMRHALAQAVHHARHRDAFGKRLSEQALMRNVLADLALEVEASTALMLRLARAYDGGTDSESERAFARIATAIGKYWVCKRAPQMIGEALECLGGNGYVEESMLPRLYREAPVNSIWEGSGNVMCLDVLRAIVREPGSLAALFAELRAASGVDRRLDATVVQLEKELAHPADAEVRARRLVEAMATALQASLLIRHAPTMVADAFCASRIARDGGLAYGTLPVGSDFEGIVERAFRV